MSFNFLQNIFGAGDGLPWKTMSDGTRVRGQVNEAILDQAKANGVTAVVCNRPDGEDYNQPTSAMVKKWCEERDMKFVFAPVSGMMVDPAMVKRMAAALNENPGAVLAYCRSGNRSKGLWSMAKKG